MGQQRFRKFTYVLYFMTKMEIALRFNHRTNCGKEKALNLGRYAAIFPGSVRRKFLTNYVLQVEESP